MKSVRWGFLAVALAACAGGPPGPTGPVVSPTGIVFEEGVPPSDTRYSQTAALYLRSAEPDRALALALEGIEADPGNPIHYFLAGIASVRISEWREADLMFQEAERIYPAYVLETEPERLAGWAEAFNRGSEAYADGLEDQAIEAWQGATHLYSMRPEAHRNLAMVLAQSGRTEEAIEVYRDLIQGLERRPVSRVLDEAEIRERDAARIETEESLADLLLLTNRFAEAEPYLRARLDREPENTRVRQDLASALVGQGKRAEAQEIYEGLLSERSLAESELYNLGVALFRANSPGDAAKAFRRLTESRPESRDAWFNYANALLAAGEWSVLVEISETLLSVDPLGETSALLVARAHLETGDEEGALGHLRRIDEAPVHIDGLTLRNAGGTTRLMGEMIGNAAQAGEELTLRFVFLGDGTEAAEDAVFRAPLQGESEPFEVDIEMRATSFRYEVIEGVQRSGAL